MDVRDPRQILARRLRALREACWPGIKVKQFQLAEALSGSGRRSVSVPLISSWESRSKPIIPPEHRLEDYATIFASARSIDGQVVRLLNLDEMTEPERQAKEELAAELKRLREDALGAARTVSPRPAAVREIAESLNAGLWRFTDGQPITIVCAQVPPDMLEQIPYADPLVPDFIAMYKYADLDALFELHGHVRAANPTSQVNLRVSGELQSDDYSSHLVSLGGVDWNNATSSVLDRLLLPVKQVAEWGKPEGAYFEVNWDGSTSQHQPLLEASGGRTVLREDVALFARSRNPFNRKRFVTICNGMYGSGVYGAVRALTDALFRDRNTEYVQDRFADSEAFCILTRVAVEKNGTVVTPDWTLPETRLFEWSRP